jgi:hypothetical protein
LDLLDGEEVPCDVEHGAAVGESRVVDDLDRDDLERFREESRALDRRRQELSQRLHAVRESCGGRRRDSHFVVVHAQSVSFRHVTVGGLFGAEHEHDIAGAGRVPHDGELEAARRPEERGEPEGDCPGLCGIGVDHDPGVRSEPERFTPNALHPNRLRHDGDGRRRWWLSGPREHGGSSPDRRRCHECHGQQHPYRAPLHRVLFPSRECEASLCRVMFAAVSARVSTTQRVICRR